MVLCTTPTFLLLSVGRPSITHGLTTFDTKAFSSTSSMQTASDFLLLFGRRSIWLNANTFVVSASNAECDGIAMADGRTDDRSLDFTISLGRRFPALSSQYFLKGADNISTFSLSSEDLSSNLIRSWSNARHFIGSVGTKHVCLWGGSIKVADGIIRSSLSYRFCRC